MIRLPVTKRKIFNSSGSRFTSSSSFIRNTFIEYFVKNHGHKQVKSSSVVPLYDPTVPFVNAGMNQVSHFVNIGIQFYLFTYIYYF